MKREVYELTPDCKNRKSFYGKAFVEVIGNMKALKSYETIVAVVNEAGEVFRTWNGWSATTSRHFDVFMRTVAGKHAIGKTDWNKMPVYKFNEKTGKISL